MNTEFLMALEEIERDRGIDKEVLIKAIEDALISAYKHNFGTSQNVRVAFDRQNGDIQVFARYEVVEMPIDVEDDNLQLTLEEARAIDPKYQVGDIVEKEVTPRSFGRMAAQPAKQVVMQRLREAEWDRQYVEYAELENEIVNAVVERVERKVIYVALAKGEGIMLPSEQIPSERYQPNDRLRVYVTEVRKTTKGPQIMVSRTHPGLLRRLFELEVPEIHSGVVQIKAVSREAGSRSKIAVASLEAQVDPLGACVGQKGTRVERIVSALGNEKVDIIKWSATPAEFVANALSPAKVTRVFANETDKSARVYVPQNQLSLAIGKEGQNARLAARLTGWKIDIKSEAQETSWADDFSDF